MKHKKLQRKGQGEDGDDDEGCDGDDHPPPSPTSCPVSPETSVTTATANHCPLSPDVSSRQTAMFYQVRNEASCPEEDEIDVVSDSDSPPCVLHSTYTSSQHCTQ